MDGKVTLEGAESLAANEFSRHSKDETREAAIALLRQAAGNGLQQAANILLTEDKAKIADQKMAELLEEEEAEAAKKSKKKNKKKKNKKGGSAAGSGVDSVSGSSVDPSPSPAPESSPSPAPEPSPKGDHSVSEGVQRVEEGSQPQPQPQT